jgi:Gram-negative bacterial TonB protein C-terminal
MTVVSLIALTATYPSLLNMPLADSEFSATFVGQRGGWIARYEVIVSPQGAPQKCTIILPSESPDFDKLTCASFLKRARFRPARDNGGVPVHAIYRSSSTWFAFGSPPRRPAFQDLVVSTVPAPGLPLPSRVALMLVIDEAGRIASCEGMNASKSKLLLNRMACDHVGKLGKMSLVYDAAGNPVRYVRNAIIVFEKDASVR